jgi:hypothetical protein
LELQDKLNKLFLAQFPKLIAIHPKRESRHGAQSKGGWVITQGHSKKGAHDLTYG